MRGLLVSGLASALLLALMLGCGASDEEAASSESDTQASVGGSTGNLGTGGGSSPVTTCEEAADAKSYIGCDFWPTVTANNVWSIFDFAVVVANAGDNTVEATVTRRGQLVGEPISIPPGSLGTIYLPWVPELKGPDAGTCSEAVAVTASTKLANGAYHLTTTYPVTVYQFNPLQYAPQGGPPGKDWSTCPAYSCPMACFTYTNDASLLLPSTALTPNARVAGWPGWAAQVPIGGFVSVTGTNDGTTVEMRVSETGRVLSGDGIIGAGPGEIVSFTLDAGEVAQLIGEPSGDLSGSLVKADKPVQVIAGIACTDIPEGYEACDHLEESMFPAETLGDRYFVTRPAGPYGEPVGHYVRIYGNVDGTILSYPSGVPPGAPSIIDAGEVVDLGVVSSDFEVTGSDAFVVGSFMLGASIVDTVSHPICMPGSLGDPGSSLATAVAQYRTRYIFLAPLDYIVSFVSVVHPTTAHLMLDGNDLGGITEPIGSGHAITRVLLGPGRNGAHELIADEPVGIQVGGYGIATSYYYPGGSDFVQIAPPPAK